MSTVGVNIVKAYLTKYTLLKIMPVVELFKKIKSAEMTHITLWVIYNIFGDPDDLKGPTVMYPKSAQKTKGFTVFLCTRGNSRQSFLPMYEKQLVYKTLGKGWTFNERTHFPCMQEVQKSITSRFTE